MFPTGTRTRFNSPVYRNGVIKTQDTAQDHYQIEGDCLPFNAHHFSIEGGVIQSDYDGGYWVATFNQYPADALNNGQMPHIMSFFEEKPLAAYSTEAVARTNPSRAYVDVVANVLEMGDVTGLLHTWGKDSMKLFKDHKINLHSGNLWRDLGSGNLTYSFALAPLIGDLCKLVNFQDQVNRRMKEIDKLAKSPKGLRKNVDLARLDASDSLFVVWQSADCYLASSTPRKAARVIRGHCRWRPAPDFFNYTRPELVGLAKRAVTGMNIDFAALWEAVPWSWLIDYGTNLGNFLKTRRNLIPAVLEQCVIVKHTISEIAIPQLRVDQHQMSGGTYRVEDYERIPGIVVPTAHFPFLSGNQMGILASLAVTRR